MSNSASLTRRSLLAGSAAATIAISAPAAAAMEPGDNHDELMMLIDLRDEIVAQHIEAIRVFDRIDMRADRPPSRPAIDLWSILGSEHVRYYYSTSSNPVFFGEAGIAEMHRYFKQQLELAANRAKCRPDEWGEWPVVKAADYRKALLAMRRRLEARRRWEVESGYLAAEAEVDRLRDELCDLERRIFSLPCRSFRDLKVKLDIVEDDRWNLDDDDLRLLLGSIRDFADTHSHPSAAGQLVPGAS